MGGCATVILVFVVVVDVAVVIVIVMVRVVVIVLLLIIFFIGRFFFPISSVGTRKNSNTIVSINSLERSNYP